MSSLSLIKYQALKHRLLTYKKKVRKTTSTSASTEIVENEVGRGITKPFN